MTCDAAVARCVLVEGIPGSGKTTTARTLAVGLARAGRDVRWHREEDRRHPVVPRALLRRRREPDFGARCVERFERFRAALPAGRTEVLDGTAFQSTARFLWSAGRDAEIAPYLAGLARTLSAAAPTLVHLRPRDPERHLREFVLPERGPDWVEKLVRHAEGTERAQRHGWRGVPGLVRFWATYATAVDAWVRALPFPVVEIDTGPGRWDDVDAALRAWLADATSRD